MLALIVVFKSEYETTAFLWLPASMFFFHVNIGKGHKASVLFYTLPLFAIIYDNETMEFILLDMLTEETQYHVFL